MLAKGPQVTLFYRHCCICPNLVQNLYHFRISVWTCRFNWLYNDKMKLIAHILFHSLWLDISCGCCYIIICISSVRPYILFQEWLKSGKHNIEYERNSPVWPGVTIESVKQVMLKSCLSIFTKYLVHCKPPSVSNAISAKYKSDDLGVSFIHEKSKRRLFIRCLAAFCSMEKQFQPLKLWDVFIHPWTSTI